MVNNLNTQIHNLFEELIALLSAESKVDSYNAQFLKYVQERQDFIKQNNDRPQVIEVIRGINRYSDEFSFTDINTKKIKTLTEALYDLANHI